MSDTKPKRAAREVARSEAAVEEMIAAATAVVSEQNVVPEPEPVSAIALAQAVPVGPACPVPTAPEGALPESAPSDRPLEGAVETPEAPEAAAETAWTTFAET